MQGKMKKEFVDTLTRTPPVVEKAKRAIQEGVEYGKRVAQELKGSIQRGIMQVSPTRKIEPIQPRTFKTFERKTPIAQESARKIMDDTGWKEKKRTPRPLPTRTTGRK